METIQYYLYVLKSLKDHKLYIGVTSNVKGRIQQHNAGKNKSTRYRRPLVLLYTQGFKSKAEAYKYEWAVKNTGKGNKALKAKLKQAEVAKVVTAGL